MSDLSVVVLAGGLSSRMNGEDKATKLYRGRPMLYWVLEAFRGLADESVVVVRDSSQEKKVKIEIGEWPGLSIATDEVPEFGPTAGMAAGFAVAGSEYCFLTACDMPGISPSVAEHIISRCSGADAAVPRWKNGLMEPLFACYRRKPALAAARRAVENDFKKVVLPLYELADIVWVPVEEELLPLDASLQTLKNVNTPDQWEESDSKSDDTGVVTSKKKKSGRRG